MPGSTPASPDARRRTRRRRAARRQSRTCPRGRPPPRRAEQDEELAQGLAPCPGRHQGQFGVDGQRREDEVVTGAAALGELLRQAEGEQRQAGTGTRTVGILAWCHAMLVHAT